MFGGFMSAKDWSKIILSILPAELQGKKEMEIFIQSLGIGEVLRLSLVLWFDYKQNGFPKTQISFSHIELNNTDITI